ncbi:MAG: GatB/YqeY domain-containing protein [Myxococcota bacterium]
MLTDEIDRLLRAAMMAKDLKTANVLRALKTKLTERRTSAGFSGELTDAIVVEVASAYARQLDKALSEYANVGERGAALAEELRFEIGYLQRFLPAKLGEDEAREIVRAAIAAIGAKEPREAGKVVGQVMRTHKGLIDAAVAKRIAEQLLVVTPSH